MAEAFELGLRVFDVEGALEAAFGGECGDASGDGADGSEADFADFAECAAEFAEDAGAAGLGGVVGGLGDVAFEFLAEVFAAWGDFDVDDADAAFCHRGFSCVVGRPRWRSGSFDVVVVVEAFAAGHARLIIGVGFRVRPAERVGSPVGPWPVAFAFESAFEFHLVPERDFRAGGRV